MVFCMADEMYNNLSSVLFGTNSGKSSTKRQFCKMPAFHSTILSIIHSLITPISIAIVVI